MIVMVGFFFSKNIATVFYHPVPKQTTAPGTTTLLKSEQNRRCWRQCQWSATGENRLAVLQNVNTGLPCDLVVPLLNTPRRSANKCSTESLHTRTATKRQEQPKRPAVGETDKMWSVHAMKHYSAIKRKYLQRSTSKP